MESVNILIAGEAGTGIDSMTKSLARAFTREGLRVLTNSEYENRIRGGHNFGMVRAGTEEITGPLDKNFHLMIAMDAKSVPVHMEDMAEGGVIVFDGEPSTLDGIQKKDGVSLVPVPMKKLAKDLGLALAANVVAVGALYGLMERDPKEMKSVLETIFGKKGKEIVALNCRAIDAGIDYVTSASKARVPFTAKGDKKKRFLLNGNEAIALGCIKGGLKFLAAYPMTPSSSIMTTLAKESRKYDIVVSHVEDEISAVCMAIGAGYGGIRAATSTSGGGFSLMAEALGLSGMLEVPVVVLEAQRPGPSTGLPTRSAQADLRLAMHAGQGDFPRLVLAPGDHRECVHLSAEAFNYAERFQIPVILLTDKYLADAFKSEELDIADGIEIERGQLVESTQGEYKRYLDTKDGVSPRAVPGTKGCAHTSTSYEHNEFGKATEKIEEVVGIAEKRWRKMKSLEESLPDPKLYENGVEIPARSLDGETVLFLWGGTKGPALEAQRLLKAQSLNTIIVQMQYIYPFKAESVKKILAPAKTIIAVEGNISGQLEGVLRQFTGISAHHFIRDYTGRPMTGEGIADEVHKVCKVHKV